MYKESTWLLNCIIPTNCPTCQRKEGDQKKKSKKKKEGYMHACTVTYQPNTSSANREQARPRLGKRWGGGGRRRPPDVDINPVSSQSS